MMRWSTPSSRHCSYPHCCKSLTNSTSHPTLNTKTNSHEKTNQPTPLSFIMASSTVSTDAYQQELLEPVTIFADGAGGGAGAGAQQRMGATSPTLKQEKKQQQQPVNAPRDHTELYAFTQTCMGRLHNEAPADAIIPSEARFVLFGVSGCGKSTFLNSFYRVCRGDEDSHLFEEPFEARSRGQATRDNWTLLRNCNLKGRSMLQEDESTKYRLYGVDGVYVLLLFVVMSPLVLPLTHQCVPSQCAAPVALHLRVPRLSLPA